MGMSDFFRRVLIPVRQRPSSNDLNTLQNYMESTTRVYGAMSLGQAYQSDPTVGNSYHIAVGAQGFWGQSFFASASPPFQILLSPGAGLGILGPASATDIDSDSGANWQQNGFISAPYNLSNYQTLNVPAPPGAGNSRIDVIEVLPSYLATDPATVGIFNAITHVFNPTVRNKSLVWDLLGRTGSVNAPNPSTAPISYVVGQTVAGGIAGATEPTTTPGYIKVARLNLDASGGAIAAISQSMIADMRPLLFPQGMMVLGGQATIPGVVGGIGSEAVGAVDLPPGVVVKMIFDNSVPPAVGESYIAHFFVIGGDLRPRTVGGSFRGTPTATPMTGVGRRITRIINFSTGVLDAAWRSRLAGTDPNYTVVNGAAAFAIGQPYFHFSVEVDHATGAALSSTESFTFNAILSAG